MILKGYLEAWAAPGPVGRPSVGGRWPRGAAPKSALISGYPLWSGRCPLRASPGPRVGPGPEYHFNIIQTP